MKKCKMLILGVAAALTFSGTGSVIEAKADAVVSDNYAIEFYAGGSSVSYYIDKENNMYVSGSNGFGVFGDGTKGGTLYTPKNIVGNVKSVASGKSGFAIVLKNDGSICTFGNNKYAQLGLNTAYNDDSETNCVLTQETPELPSGVTIEAVAAGDAFSMLLSSDGDVYTCGRAGDGQTGQAGLNLTRKTVVGKFTKIDESYFGNEKITKIDAAENAGFALSESGNVYVWGANDRGILANGETDENLINETPVKIEELSGITEISASTMTAFALDKDGRLYAWGDNSVGQTGLDSAETAIASPTEITKFYETDGTETEIEISSVLAGGRTNFVLAKDGRIFSFGESGKGQAAFNLQSAEYATNPCVRESSVVKPMRVTFYKPISLENDAELAEREYKDKIPVDTSTKADVKIAALIGSSGDRTFVKDTAGNTWSWGVNLYAMACSGDAFDCSVPVRSTLYRKENYDKTYVEKNYLIKPAVVMSCVVAFAVCWMTAEEIKVRKQKKQIR